MIMKNFVTVKQMREIDRRTIEDVGIPGLLLMENAGIGVVKVIEKQFRIEGQKRINIFCGKGNNGGDGMVIARHLFNREFILNIYLAGEKESVRGDALVNLKAVEGLGLKITVLQKEEDLKLIGEADLIVDALLGTGITGEVKGFMAMLIEWINCKDLPVVSVDTPSGLHCDDGSYQGGCIYADQTVTMAELKRGFLLSPGRELAGQVTVADIGVPSFVPKSVGIKTHLLEQKDIAYRLPERPVSAHKGNFGKVAILAGSQGMTGAASLSSMASLKVGAGLVILGIPRSLNPIMEEKLTEVMTKPLAETKMCTISQEAEETIDELLGWADILAIGPGLSTFPETAELIRRIVQKTELPFLLDADGINAFEGKASLLEKKQGKCILTPHYGELARLIDLPVATISRNRIDIASECASRFSCIIVLKGAPTVIADPGGEVYVNSTGNSGLATAGSGDVLTGAIAGFLGQDCSSLDAALCGVYIHGLAGDIGAEALGERSLIAGDIIHYLSAAFQRVEQ
jgi:NAD(P)H-hydrate epimerase